MMPVNIGLLRGGAEYAMRVYAPEPIPAAPTPAMARPTIRASEFGATPQIRLPTSKTNMERRKVILRGKYL